MVNADFMNVLNTALVALAAKYGVPAPAAGFEQYVDNTCYVRFTKDVANAHREGITSIVKEISRIDGIKDFGDTHSDKVFRGNETRDVYFDVRRKHWHKSDADRKWDEEYDKLLDGDPEITAKFDAAEKAKRDERRKFYKEYLIPIPTPSPTHPTELYLTMAYEPYDAIKSGEKVTEFRAYCETWVKRILANMSTLKTVKFQRGYGGPGRPKPEQMIWTIKGIELYDINTRDSSDPINVKEGFIPTHIAIDLGERLDGVGPLLSLDEVTDFPDQITWEMVAGFAADIGGSTHPHHGVIGGTEFVLKCGSYSGTSSDAHVHNEYVADCLLREAGCHVPESREYRADIGHGKVETLRLSRFVKGRPLGLAMRSAGQEGRCKIREEVARTYPVLSFLSAIDSYQHPEREANVLVDEEYNLWFIDNGASFEFSAMGGTTAKSWYWDRTDVLGENGFFALRDAKGPYGYYQSELRELLKGVTDEQLRQEASRYDFVKLAKSLPVDFLRGNLLAYAENLNAWARGASATGKRVIRKSCGKAVSDRIKIVTGKIECTVADAIVNAANSVHIGGGGIDGAIHRAAGPRLAKACSDFTRNERGEWCPTGDARTTPAFDIKSVKYVIHTAGPDCRSGYSEEWHGSELASCYRSVLNEAVKHKCKIVAIPSISTGIFGFPLEDAARIATATVAEFLKKHAEIEVTFVMWDGDGKGDGACDLYLKALAKYAALSFSKKEFDEFQWLFYHGEEECPIRKEGPFYMLWNVERHIVSMNFSEVKKHYINGYAHIPHCIFDVDASSTVKALVHMIYVGCDTFASAEFISRVYFRKSLKVTDLRFRFYAGEDHCPERFAKDNEKRWWHQESTVKGDQAVRDFAKRAMSEWPCAVMCSINDDGERAVALSGYLNTKQWGEDVAGDFDGYFEYPVNDYRLGC